jgi:hypothetical protein
MAKQRRANGEGGITDVRTAPGWPATPSRPHLGRKRKVLYARSYAEARRKLAEALADCDQGLYLRCQEPHLRRVPRPVA